MRFDLSFVRQRLDSELSSLTRVWHMRTSLLVCFTESAKSLAIDANSGKVVQRLPAAAGGAVAPDGSWLACRQGDDVEIWLKAH